MNKYKVFEEKIETFLSKKAKSKEGINPHDLKIIISAPAGKLLYELWDAKKGFHGYQSLREILNLNMAEKIFISDKDVEEVLTQTIHKQAKEINSPDEQIQIVITGNKTYYCCRNREKITDLQITQIF